MLTSPRSLLRALAFAVAFAACAHARAHDILLLPFSISPDGSGFSLEIKYGHPGDYSLPDREKLFDLDCYPTDGTAPYSLLADVENATDTTLAWKGRRGHRHLDAGGVAVVGARFDNGYFAAIDKDHYFNTSKRELPQAVSSGHYLKFAKALVSGPNAARRAGFDRVLGYRLELIPKADPFSLHPGDELPVQVLFEGKPVGAGVEVDIISGDFPMTKGMELPAYKTDENGVARVKLERAGVQSLGADRVIKPSADPQLADEDNLASSLSFVLPGR